MPSWKQLHLTGTEQPWEGKHSCPTHIVPLMGAAAPSLGCGDDALGLPIPGKSHHHGMSVMSQTSKPDTTRDLIDGSQYILTSAGVSLLMPWKPGEFEGVAQALSCNLYKGCQRL